MQRHPSSRRTPAATALALISAVASLAACDPAPQRAVAGDAGETSGRGPQLAATYLKANGGALDACFGPPPAMVGPGGIRTVADDAKPKPATIASLVIAIDASGSMAARTGGETKMDAAKRAAAAFLRGVPAATQVGLVAFGHRGSNAPSGKAASCAGVESIYPLGAARPAEVESALRAVRATGWTPLAAAITTAGGAFDRSRAPGSQVVYVVSDGLETCGGDPVAAARTLNQGPVKAIVDIIGFDLTPADRAQLAAVAAAGGGTFVEARSGDDIRRMLDDLQHKARAVSAISAEYVDGSDRTSDNNRAVGRYATELNRCVTRATATERDGLRTAIDAAGVTAAERDAALADLARRHEAYRARADKAYADLMARADAANAAIAGQQRSSERRLGITPAAAR